MKRCGAAAHSRASTPPRAAARPSLALRNAPSDRMSTAPSPSWRRARDEVMSLQRISKKVGGRVVCSSFLRLPGTATWRSTAMEGVVNSFPFTKTAARQSPRTGCNPLLAVPPPSRHVHWLTAISFGVEQDRRQNSSGSCVTSRNALKTPGISFGARPETPSAL